MSEMEFMGDSIMAHGKHFTSRITHAKREFWVDGYEVDEALWYAELDATTNGKGES